MHSFVIFLEEFAFRFRFLHSYFSYDNFIVLFLLIWIATPSSSSGSLSTVTELPTDVPSLSIPALASARVESSWHVRIQRLALAISRTPSLLDNPSLGLLVIKSTLRPTDCRHLNEVETNELFVNVIHSILEGVLCTYAA